MSTETGRTVEAPRPLACTGVTYVSADLDEDRRLRYLAECDAEPPLGDCGWVVDLESQWLDGDFAALNNLTMTRLHQQHLDFSAERQATRQSTDPESTP